MIDTYEIVGIGDWGLGIGDWGLPNPQSPIPNPQYNIILLLYFSYNILLLFYTHFIVILSSLYIIIYTYTITDSGINN